MLGNAPPPGGTPAPREKARRSLRLGAILWLIDRIASNGHDLADGGCVVVAVAVDEVAVAGGPAATWSRTAGVSSSP